MVKLQERDASGAPKVNWNHKVSRQDRSAGIAASTVLGFGGTFFFIWLFGRIVHAGWFDPDTLFGKVALVACSIVPIIALATVVMTFQYWLYIGRRNDLGIDNSDMNPARFLMHWLDSDEAYNNLRLVKEDGEEAK